MPHGGGGIPVISNIMSGISGGSFLGTPHVSSPSGAPTTPEAVKSPVDLTPAQIQANALKYGSTQAPSFLGLPTAMTPQQKQSAIATGGVSSNDPRYRDPETARYYSSLLYSSPDNPLSDIDKQYIKSLGENPQAETNTGYISALERSIAAMQ